LSALLPTVSPIILYLKTAPMRSFILFAFGIVLTTLLSAQPANTFFSTFDAERGNTLTPAGDGNLWVGAMKDERVLLIKLSPAGEILTKQSIGFEGIGLDNEYLVDLTVDSDGMLTGCGNFENDNAGRGFVFRYNPVTQTILWAHVVRSDVNYLFGITELGPGGDFVLYGNPHTGIGDDAELLQLRRSTGQIVPGKAKRLGIGSSDNISQALYYKGALYACGRFTNGNNGFENFARMRNTLCKLDTATLQPLWTRMGPLPTSASARLYGRDMIIDNEAIVSTFSGDATGPDLFSSTIFLQKNDLAGNLLWAKQYDLPAWNGEFAEELISLPDGYMLYGYDALSDTSRLFLLKVDKQGNPLSAVKIDFDENEEFPDIPARSKILRLGDALYLTALSQNKFGQTQGILAKTDLNGWVSDSCGFFRKTAVNLVPMPAPVSEVVAPTVTASPAVLTSATNSLHSAELTFYKKCGAVGTCPGLPDLKFSLDSMTCKNGVPLLYVSICNVGGQPYDGNTWFSIFPRNPLTDSTEYITGSIVTTQSPLLPGDCWTGTLSSGDLPPNDFDLDTFPKFYGMLGHGFPIKTPVSFSDFPFSPDGVECGYVNNFDSLTVPKNLCGNCSVPSTFVKTLGKPQQWEWAFSMCKSADGNVFIAGRQGLDPMIAKITPLGEPIWVRNFPGNPNFPLEMVEIIEDSEQKLVICGTEGSSPSNRQAVAFRYDPVADQVLWFRQYPANRPVGAGILEKTPGGNYILCTNSQEFVGGMQKTRSSLLELNRMTGEVVPTLAVRYLGAPNLNINDMGVRNGNLYAVGSWQTHGQGPTMPFLSKISSTTGEPEWTLLTDPDSSSVGAEIAGPGAMAMDQDFIYVAGNEDISPNEPVSGYFLYLAKYRLNGSLVWMRRYDIQMAASNLIRSGNSLVAFGSGSFNRWGMVKVDIETGDLIASKTLDLALPSTTYTGVNRRRLLLPVGGDLLMLDHTEQNGQGDLLLIRTDQYFGLDDTCSLLRSVPLTVTTRPAKVKPLVFEVVPSMTTAALRPISFKPDSLKASKLCPRCQCEGVPDITYEVTSIFCAADSMLQYEARVCNVGLGAFTGPVEVTFYDQNPLLSTAQALWSTSLNEPLAPGQCKTISRPLPSIASQYARLYTFVGVGSSTATPLHPNLFPFSPGGIEECRYTNNLDSFVVKTPVCNGCENPTTFIKTMGRADRAEFGYSLCASSDGNVYMAGRQGKRPMIAKMTPNGEMIWVRNFTAGSFFQEVDIVEIFEDSGGKIILCGSEGHSSNFRSVVAMRYDPDANQMLWFKRYAELSPEALGIFEKTPGGNLILYGYSQEEFGTPPFNYAKSRSHIWEIDPATGEIVPTLAEYYAGEPSVYFQDMVPYKNNLYCVGSWYDYNNQQGRLMLAKLSTTDGTPTWIQGVVPDSTQATRFYGYRNILVDNDRLVVSGYGILNYNMPNQINLTYLSNYALDGTLLWMKSYESILSVVDMVSLPEGYILYGLTQNNRWGLIKTDKDGNVLASKQVSLPYASGQSYYTSPQNEVLLLPNHLLMVSHFDAGAFDDLLLIKTDHHFNLDDSCNWLQPLPLTTRTQPAKTSPIITPFQPYAVTALDLTTDFQSDSLNIKQVCPQCPCVDKPDIRYSVDKLGCSPTGDVLANVRICNLGQVSPTAGFNLTFYDKNPLTGPATPLYSTFVSDQPGFGDCIQQTILLDASLLNYPKIYTLVGAWKDVQTPISLSDFPLFNGFAECDYTNNLDSFEIKPPQPQKPDLGPDRAICSGQTTTLDAGSGYVEYNWVNGPPTRTYTVGAAGAYTVETTDACGQKLRDTVHITVLPSPQRSVNVALLPGDSVTINGATYFGAATVVDTVPSLTGGCDTVVTYMIQLVVTQISLQCPANLTVTLPPNTTTTVVDYTLPTANTTCPNPLITFQLLQGPPVGGAFVQGTTQVCYQASNQCGIRDTCCFTVTAQLSDPPCDLKTPAGCIRYELLGIRLDALGQRRYRVRMTNTCSSPLEFAYIQLPNGVLAVSPKEAAIYTAPAGNTYTARNPNASPFYSVRYKALTGSLNNGKSDIFEYTLPQQVQPAYIHVSAKLADGTTSETHLNTFYCPEVIVMENLEWRMENSEMPPPAPFSILHSPFSIWPNPTEGTLFVRWSASQSAAVQAQVFNAQGQMVLSRPCEVQADGFELRLPPGLANGLYYLRVEDVSGQRPSQAVSGQRPSQAVSGQRPSQAVSGQRYSQAVRFVLER